MPQQARWDEIKAVSILNIGAELPWGGKFSGVAKLIDDAFDAIEKDNEKLKGVLQRISGYAVNEDTLRGLIILFSDTNFTRPTYNGEPVHLGAKDILGHVYEYFLGRFAQAEGKRGGQYFTPKSIVSLIVEMLEPYSGRVYDPAMGSGGFFVQTERFITAHQGNINNVSIYGQEFNPTTWKLAAMNMASAALITTSANTTPTASRSRNISTKRWISSWQTHHSTSAIGGANPWPMIHVGHTARRPKAMPTSLGCNT